MVVEPQVLQGRSAGLVGEFPNVTAGPIHLFDMGSYLVANYPRLVSGL